MKKGLREDHEAAGLKRNSFKLTSLGLSVGLLSSFALNAPSVLAAETAQAQSTEPAKASQTEQAQAVTFANEEAAKKALEGTDQLPNAKRPWYEYIEYRVPKYQRNKSGQIETDKDRNEIKVLDDQGNTVTAGYSYTRNNTTHAKNIGKDITPKQAAAVEYLLAQHQPTVEQKELAEAYSKSPEFVTHEFLEDLVVEGGDLKYRSVHAFEKTPDRDHYHHRLQSNYNADQQAGMAKLIERNQGLIQDSIRQAQAKLPEEARNLVDTKEEGGQVSHYIYKDDKGEKHQFSADQLTDEQKEAADYVVKRYREKALQDAYRTAGRWSWKINNRVEDANGNVYYQFRTESGTPAYVPAFLLTADQQAAADQIVKLEEGEQRSTLNKYARKMYQRSKLIQGKKLVRSEKTDGSKDYNLFYFKDKDGKEYKYTYDELQDSIKDIPGFSPNYSYGSGRYAQMVQNILDIFNRKLEERKTFRDRSAQIEARKTVGADKTSQPLKQSAPVDQPKEIAAPADTQAEKQSILTASRMDSKKDNGKTSGDQKQSSEHRTASKSQVASSLPQTAAVAGPYMLTGLSLIAAGSIFSRKRKGWKL